MTNIFIFNLLFDSFNYYFHYYYYYYYYYYYHYYHDYYYYYYYYYYCYYYHRYFFFVIIIIVVVGLLSYITITITVNYLYSHYFSCYNRFSYPSSWNSLWSKSRFDPRSMFFFIIIRIDVAVHIRCQFRFFEQLIGMPRISCCHSYCLIDNIW